MVTAERAAELARSWSDELRLLLGPTLVGVYLHGSLALGDFVPGHSDVDLLVVERGFVPAAIRRMALEFWAKRSTEIGAGRDAHAGVEVSHVGWGAWRDGPRIPYTFHYSEEHRDQAEALGAASADPSPPVGGGRDLDLPAHFTVMAARGIRVMGPAWSSVVPAVPRRWYLESLGYDFDDAPASSPSTVLNACRTLRYLESGYVGSKGEGGRWLLDRSDEGWHALVHRAMAARRQGLAILEDASGSEEFRERARAALASALAAS